MRTMPTLRTLHLVTAGLVIAGCQGNREPSASTSRADPPAPTSREPAPAKPATGEPAPAADLAEKMRHCPVTLPGVKAELADVDGGVRFALLASAPDVVAEARRRAHALADLSEGRSDARHGGGKGGGFMRNCPVVTKDTKIVAADIEGGVQITVTPADASKVAELRAMTRERLERAPLERAEVVRVERSEQGETRLFSGGVADLDGDGMLELIAGGFSSTDHGRHPTIIAYRQVGAQWSPVAEAGWDGGAASMVRNVEIADVDGDGKPEVIALGRIGATPHTCKARLAVLSLDGGKLVKRAEIDWLDGEYTHGYGLALGDLDGDRAFEIVSGGFQFDGTTETGFVRVWSFRKGQLAVRAKTVLDGQGAPSMRINDLALGDVDGDRRVDIVVAGRHGPLKTADSKFLERRREAGELAVLAFAGDQLTPKLRYSWAKGTSMRLRSVVVADLDADGRNEIVAGGQYDFDGKSSLGLFAHERGKLVLRDDASSTAEGVSGEIKDLVVAGTGKDARVFATGTIGDRLARAGDLAVWRLRGAKLVRDSAIASRNGDDTLARAVVVVPGASSVLTIGHAKDQASMIGQVLRWRLGDRAL